MEPKNPNYRETREGYERRENAPDASHKSRIDWGRVESVNNARQGVSELRQEQERRNEEHRQKHGNG